VLLVPRIRFRPVPVAGLVLLAYLFTPVLAGNSGTSLKGSARTARHRPVVGASVVIRSGAHPGTILLTSTDGKGNLKTMKLPDGLYDIAIAKDGLTTVVKKDVQIKFPFRPVVEIDMMPENQEAASGELAVLNLQKQDETIALTGEVKTLDGRILPDISIALVRVDGDENPVRVRSGEDGTFEWPRLAPGDWRVEIRGAGFLPIRATVSLTRSMKLLSLMVPQPAGHLLPALDLLPEEIPVYPGGSPGLLDLRDGEETAPGADLVSGDGG
jgi:hypothetical protein